MRPFKICAIFILLVTFGLGFFSTFKTYTGHGLSFSDICFSSSCIIEFSETFSGSIAVFKAGTYVLWIFAAVSGVYIALNSYVSTVRAAALTGYINHVRLFRDYLKEQSEELKRINWGKIDSHIWYELGFPNSKKGDVSVSPQYLDAVQSVAKVFEESSRKLQPSGGKFVHVDHQNRLMTALKPFGINITRMPKNDFIAMENEIISLLDAVNRTFAENVLELYKCERRYL